jgi:hypothetical protein
MGGKVAAAELATMMYHSWNDKLARIPDATKVFPAHGAGSLCGAHLSDQPVSTFGEQKKVNPYLLPLYDALHDLLPPAQVERFSERGLIEIAPLAFMRGRTLNSAFVILDEAQNTTPKQMKMFLTRLGREARAVVTGDVTQADLPEGDTSGLIHALRVLQDVKGVAFVRLEQQDIVRHPLVRRIVAAYDRAEGIAGEDALAGTVRPPWPKGGTP